MKVEDKRQAQASEPVGVVIYSELAGLSARFNKDVSVGDKLFTTPQPVASCSRCVESDIRNVKNLNIIREQKGMLLYRANLLDKLQARCAEQTENVRISKELAVFNKQEAEKQYERANAAEARCAELQNRYDCNTEIMHARTKKMNEYSDKLTAAESLLANITEERGDLREIITKIGKAIDYDWSGGLADLVVARIARDKLLLDECEKAFQRLNDEGGLGYAIHRRIEIILAKLKDRKEGDNQV